MSDSMRPHRLAVQPTRLPRPGIIQARTLEWVAISFSNTWKLKVKVKSLSHVQPSATPWTAAHQAPLSMGFSRQEHWSGMPLQYLLIDTKSTNALNVALFEYILTLHCIIFITNCSHTPFWNSFRYMQYYFLKSCE